MGEILSFSISHMKILEEDELITLIQLKPVITGANRHNTYFSLDAIKNAEPTLYNKPMNCIWKNGDFVEHARTAMDVAMRNCVGCIPETNNSEILEESGESAQYINAAIWKYYFPNVAWKLKNNDSTKISMEISVSKSHKRDDGLVEIDEYKYVGFTLLGENMLEAIPAANAKIIKYSTSDYDCMVSDTNRQLSQFSIPESVKKNAKTALELKQKNPQLISFAKEIVNNEKLSFSKINWILNKIQNLKKESNIIFFGGLESEKWCKDIVEQSNLDIKNKMKKEDEDLMTKEAMKKLVLKFGLNSAQIRELCNTELSKYKYKDDDYQYCKYWLESFDEEYIYAYDSENSNTKRIKYTLSGTLITIDAESAEVVIGGGYMLVSVPTGEVAPVVGLSVSDNGASTVEVEEYKSKYDEMCGKYSDMQKEFAILQTFKADTEKKEMESKAEELYVKYNIYISDEEKKDLNVKLFSVDNFDSFRKEVFAIVTPKMEAENLVLKQSVTKTPGVDTIQYSTMPILDMRNDGNKSSLEKLKEYANS